MSGYFQFHERNLVDALHCSDVLPPETFCYFSLGKFAHCQVLGSTQKHIHVQGDTKKTVITCITFEIINSFYFSDLPSRINALRVYQI